MNENFWFAFLLTLFAGLATGIGSILAVFAKRTNTRLLSLSLGFSAGVMLYVSFVEIFAKASSLLTDYYGNSKGYLYATLAFFGGMLFIALIDKLVPDFENPHEIRDIEEIPIAEKIQEQDTSGPLNAAVNNKKNPLYRMGMFSALAIAIHNFPEGLATFAAALKDPAIGISIAVAIGIHNIPEGIAVSVPIYYSTGSRMRAFVFSFLSGLSEPLGALVGYFLLRSLFADSVFGMLFASVAGIMVFISLDELLPAAEKYGEHHLAIYGLMAGMVIMASSLVFFNF